MATMTGVRKRLLSQIYLMPRIPKTFRLRKFAIRKLSIHHESVPPGLTPFVILSTGRSGSTLLGERLSSCWTTVRNDQEIFNPKRQMGRTFEESLRNTYFSDTGHRFIGCKVLAGQVTDQQLKEVLSIPGLRVVLLRRNNRLRQFVSLQIAIRDKQWKLQAGTERVDVTSRVVHVDVKELLEYRNKVNAWYDRFDAVLGDLPVVRVTYEDMLDDLDREIRRIGDFLGAGSPNRLVPSRLARQNPEPLRELIANFSELREELTAGGHTELLSMMDA